MCAYGIFSVNCVFYVFLQYFDTVGWVLTCGGTAAAAPPPFRPSDPALCGSRPL